MSNIDLSTRLRTAVAGLRLVNWYSLKDGVNPVFTYTLTYLQTYTLLFVRYPLVLPHISNLAQQNIFNINTAGIKYTLQFTF